MIPAQAFRQNLAKLLDIYKNASRTTRSTDKTTKNKLVNISGLGMNCQQFFTPPLFFSLSRPDRPPDEEDRE